MSINKVAVIGAGVMGAGIAAHLSNAGVEVLLLDIVPEDAANRNIVAELGIRKIQKAEPSAFMRKKNSSKITACNIEDHLEALQDMDWVIEAVVENPEIKKSLYKKLQAQCNSDTIISSNTSTLPLKQLTKGMDTAFSSRFIITHFFNPPRYMRLLEIVQGPETRPDLIKKITEFADLKLGKGCVFCNDTPGFIANRIGIYWLQNGMIEAFNRGLSVEEADAVMGLPMGIPKTGIFGLLDLIGLDLLPHIMTSMRDNLPDSDPLQVVNELPSFVKTMIELGDIGRKAKGGFYRLNKSDGQRIKESRSLLTGIYHTSEKPKLDHIALIKKRGYPAFFEFDDKTSRFAWQVISQTIVYAANLIPEIADDICAIDQAMRLGFNWQYGPFELYDRIGPQWFNQTLTEQGRDIPKLLQNATPCYQYHSGQFFHLDLNGAYQSIDKPEEFLSLSDQKLINPVVLKNGSASLWDIGQGIACLEFHSKMNTLDMQTMEMIRQSIDKISAEFSGLVIYNEGEHFSAGANLGLLISAIHEQKWEQVEYLVNEGQQSFMALKYAPFPVVGAPSGLALGGGCEILMHCDAIQAHAELYMGLVEVGVGLVPAWGGCKEFLRRCLDQPSRPGGPIPPLVKAFETIGMAKVSKSAFDAQSLLFLRATDGITMNRARVLADAKARAIEMAESYQVPEQQKYPLPGKTARILMHMATKAMRLTGKASDYDLEIGDQLSYVLSGGSSNFFFPLSEQKVMDLERAAFVHLVQNRDTQARLEHMLKTGKPLRN